MKILNTAPNNPFKKMDQEQTSSNQPACTRNCDESEYDVILSITFRGLSKSNHSGRNRSSDGGERMLTVSIRIIVRIKALVFMLGFESNIFIG